MRARYYSLVCAYNRRAGRGGRGVIGAAEWGAGPTGRATLATAHPGGDGATGAQRRHRKQSAREQTGHGVRSADHRRHSRGTPRVRTDSPRRPYRATLATGPRHRVGDLFGVPYTATLRIGRAATDHCGKRCRSGSGYRFHRVTFATPTGKTATVAVLAYRSHRVTFATGADCTWSPWKKPYRSHRVTFATHLCRAFAARPRASRTARFPACRYLPGFAARRRPGPRTGSGIDARTGPEPLSGLRPSPRHYAVGSSQQSAPMSGHPVHRPIPPTQGTVPTVIVYPAYPHFKPEKAGALPNLLTYLLLSEL